MATILEQTIRCKKVVFLISMVGYLLPHNAPPSYGRDLVTHKQTPGQVKLKTL